MYQLFSKRFFYAAQSRLHFWDLRAQCTLYKCTVRELHLITTREDMYKYGLTLYLFIKLDIMSHLLVVVFLYLRLYQLKPFDVIATPGLILTSMNVFTLKTKLFKRAIMASQYVRHQQWGRGKWPPCYRRIFEMPFIERNYLNCYHNFKNEVHQDPIDNAPALFRLWVGVKQGTIHYQNQHWLIHRRIYASLGLYELRGHFLDDANMNIRQMSIICILWLLFEWPRLINYFYYHGLIEYLLIVLSICVSNRYNIDEEVLQLKSYLLSIF